jgi:hypothetical protein
MLGESRLLAEWLAANHADRAWHIQFRVGTHPEVLGIDMEDEGEVRLARNLNRRVDAVIEPPPDLIVVEATMYRPTDKLGRLKEYLLLLQGTPDVASWPVCPVVPVLLTGQDDPVARVLCAEMGIKYELYEPPWLDEWLALYPDRRRRTPHAGMIDRAQNRTPGR